jgi:aspartyl-tRNA(Asn)/glutamyl-tRNA(Gln) amidotransferase subunit A
VPGKKIVFIVLTLYGVFTTANAEPAKSFDFDHATITSVHAAMSAHQLTCQQVVNFYISRIKQYDLDTSRGAPLNAIVNISPNVYQEAQALDDYSQQHNGQFIGPLHCIPVIVKDNVDTYDTPSSSGSLALLGSQPTKDAFIVKKLREAGAIIIGKGGMDEFASGLYGKSSRSGRIGNAYNPNKNPGGSSGGPAVAVSANFAMLGIGSDNSGSVRVPAVFNGIDGLRPSMGLLSQNGIFPRDNLEGTAGPLARNMKDLAIMLSVIAQPDPDDPNTLHIPRVSSYTDFFDKNALQGKHIGLVTSICKRKTRHTDPTTDEILQTAYQRLKTQGAIIVPVQLPDFNCKRDDVMAGEIDDVNHYLNSFPTVQKNFTDLCNSGYTENLFGSKKACLKHIEDTAAKGSPAYKAVQARFVKNRDYVTQVMETKHLDALLVPITSKGAVTYDANNINTWLVPLSSSTGMPALALVAGFTHEKIPMPVGFELDGKMYDEANLLAMGYAYEKASPVRLIPQLGAGNLNAPLLSLDIPQLNNLFTLVGYTMYTQVMAKHGPEALTPAKAKTITEQVVKEYLQETGE